jgi:hypothetical protein
MENHEEKAGIFLRTAIKKICGLDRPDAPIIRSSRPRLWARSTESK